MRFKKPRLATTGASFCLPFLDQTGWLPAASVRGSPFCWRAVARAAFGLIWIGWLLLPGPALAQSHLRRCKGAQGEPVFTDRRCSSIGSSEVRAHRNQAFLEASDKVTAKGSSSCAFASKKLSLADPAFDGIEVKLKVWIDADGPGLAILVSGEYRWEDKRRPAELDDAVMEQGLLLGDGRFFAADSLPQRDQLGFGRSRSRSILAAASKSTARLLIRLDGYQQAVQSSPLEAIEISDTLAAAGRCWRLKREDKTYIKQ